MISIKTFSITDSSFATFDELISEWLTNNPDHEIVSMKASANNRRSNLHVMYKY